MSWIRKHEKCFKFPSQQNGNLHRIFTYLYENISNHQHNLSFFLRALRLKTPQREVSKKHKRCFYKDRM